MQCNISWLKYTIYIFIKLKGLQNVTTLDVKHTELNI